MTAYKSKNVGEVKRLYKARDIWNAFIEGNYKTAEPGLIFWSKMSQYSPSNYVGRPIACTNPCGEIPLEDGGACNLGSINLSRMVKEGYTSSARIDWELLKQTTMNLTRFLDNVVWWNETLNALEKQREAAKLTRRLGLGIMGIADMCNQLGIGYDSEEGLKLLEQILDVIAQTAYATSAHLAREKGSAPCFNYAQYSQNPFFQEVISDDVKSLVRQYGLRNIALLSIAPTGTISNAIKGFELKGKNYIGISGGIEPIFALYYTRRSETLEKGKDTYFKVFHSTVQAYIDMKQLGDTIQGTSDEADMKKVLPECFFRTAHYISPDMRVRMQGIAQKYIDHSISSTVNLSEDIDPETVSDIYLNAWKNGLKGITVYRDGSRYPVLSVEGKETDFQRFKKKQFKIKDGDRELVVKGDDVLVTASGRLTTMYHAKAKGLF
jgi:ribonucleoside-diphosphate reductase alpha chain